MPSKKHNKREEYNKQAPPGYKGLNGPPPPDNVRPEVVRELKKQLEPFVHNLVSGKLFENAPKNPKRVQGKDVNIIYEAWAPIVQESRIPGLMKKYKVKIGDPNILAEPFTDEEVVAVEAFQNTWMEAWADETARLANEEAVEKSVKARDLFPDMKQKPQAEGFDMKQKPQAARPDMEQKPQSAHSATNIYYDSPTYGV